MQQVRCSRHRQDNTKGKSRMHTTLPSLATHAGITCYCFLFSQNHAADVQHSMWLSLSGADDASDICPDDINDSRCEMISWSNITQHIYSLGSPTSSLSSAWSTKSVSGGPLTIWKQPNSASGGKSSLSKTCILALVTHVTRSLRHTQNTAHPQHHFRAKRRR